ALPGRMGPPRPGASKHLPERPRRDRAGRNAEGASARLLRRPDHRRRGIRGERRVRARRRAPRPGPAARLRIPPSPGDHGARRSPPARQRRGAPARLRVPADERGLRSLSAARRAAPEAGPQAAPARAGPARPRSVGRRDRCRVAPRTCSMAFHRTAAVALLCVACTESLPGKKLASGLARGLIARDGAVAFLLDARKPADGSAPDDLFAGDLWLDDHKVGSGVSTGEGAYAFSPRSANLAFLSAWRFRDGEGELWVASGASAPRQIAGVARAFAWSSRGELGFVGRDAIGIGDRIVPLPGAQSIAWAPDGRRLAARASAAAGGKLWTVDAQSGAAREIAVATSDFAFASDGAIAALGPPPPKGGDRPLLVDGVRVADATAFSFSPDGREIALLSTGKQPGESS